MMRASDSGMVIIYVYAIPYEIYNYTVALFCVEDEIEEQVRQLQAEEAALQMGITNNYVITFVHSLSRPPYLISPSTSSCPLCTLAVCILINLYHNPYLYCIISCLITP